MKKFLIFVPFLFLSTNSFGFNPTIFLHQNFWLIKKIMSLFQQNNFQANIATTGQVENGQKKQEVDYVKRYRDLIAEADDCDNIEECKHRIRVLVKIENNMIDFHLKLIDELQNANKVIQKQKETIEVHQSNIKKQKEIIVIKDDIINNEKNKSLIIGAIGVGVGVGIVLIAAAVFAWFSSIKVR